MGFVYNGDESNTDEINEEIVCCVQILHVTWRFINSDAWKTVASGTVDQFIVSRIMQEFISKQQRR